MSKPRSIAWAGGPAVPLGLLACVLTWCGYGCQSSHPTTSSVLDPPPSAAPAPATATPPVVQVTGGRGEYDLGKVKAGGKYRVVFAIHNDSDKPLRFVRVQPDCTCIAAVESPESIAPSQTANVVAEFTPPNLEVTYGSELIILTDNPLRKTIHLGVKGSIHK